MKHQLKTLRNEVDTCLESRFQNTNIPERLKESMTYSLRAGGKRIRPILCLVSTELFGLDRSKILSFAAGLECIHTYSLIHDDLPAMDNDDLRRGQPTNHIAYGEALAILAGDGLLTEAFSLMLSTELPSDRIVQAVQKIATAAGPKGMVGGQALDITMTGQDGHESFEGLKTMHNLKTGALIEAACSCGALLAGANHDDLERTSQYGQSIGLAFQVADDILDVIGDRETLGKTPGGDEKQGKLTYPSLLGLEASRHWGQQLVAQAHEALSPYTSPSADFLRELAQYIIDRVE
jgi:geranylgeranyl diphosphate synthase type II